MGVSKKELFTNEQTTLADLAKAIAHPARIAILQHLLKTETCICGDIVEVLHLAQSTVSQHLKELKNAGIIKGNIEGTAICYCLNEEVLHELKQLFGDIVHNIQEKKRSCC
jgi:DNA-binding transcriptional ArsR family regulator